MTAPRRPLAERRLLGRTRADDEALAAAWAAADRDRAAREGDNAAVLEPGTGRLVGFARVVKGETDGH